MLKFQSGNFALPQYDDESMAGAKPFASFPAPNVSQEWDLNAIKSNFRRNRIVQIQIKSNTFDAPGTMRPADLTY